MDRRKFLASSLAVGAGVVSGCKADQPPNKDSKQVVNTLANKDTFNFQTIKTYLDSIPAVDTHSHLYPYENMRKLVVTDKGPGMNLYGIWSRSYYSGTHPLAKWKPKMRFDKWWAKAKNNFINARTTSYYRYQLPIFTDLYGVDFEQITDAQAHKLNHQIFENYRSEKWIHHVITERANIELLFIDQNWCYGELTQHYPFQVKVLRVQHLMRGGMHPAEFEKGGACSGTISPYEFAKKYALATDTIDDYLNLLDKIIDHAKYNGAVCFKQALAWRRGIDCKNVPKERAAKAYGKRRKELTAQKIKDFEDFIMWQLTKLSAKYNMPFQIHTGPGYIPQTNPMILVELIDKNPKTKFILFHGGYPWVSETAAITLRFPHNVWIDSCWMPTISYTMAKRAFHEWLDVVGSNRIMWGSDCDIAEGTYGATDITRRCLAEVLAERVQQKLLTGSQALYIGKQILRDNALELFPQLKNRVKKLTLK